MKNLIIVLTVVLSLALAGNVLADQPSEGVSGARKNVETSVGVTGRQGKATRSAQPNRWSGHLCSCR